MKLAEQDLPENSGWRMQELLNLTCFSEPLHGQSRRYSRIGVTVLRALSAIGLLVDESRSNDYEERSEEQALLTSDASGMANAVSLLRRFPYLTGAIYDADDTCLARLVASLREDAPGEDVDPRISFHEVGTSIKGIVEMPNNPGNPRLFRYTASMKIRGQEVNMEIARGTHGVVLTASQMFVAYMRHFNIAKKLSRKSLTILQKLGQQGSIFKHKATCQRFRRPAPTRNASAMNIAVTFEHQVTSTFAFEVVLAPIRQRWDDDLTNLQESLHSLKVGPEMHPSEKIERLARYEEEAERMDAVAQRYKKAAFELLRARYLIKYHIFGDHPLENGVTIDELNVTVDELNPNQPRSSGSIN